MCQIVNEIQIRKWAPRRDDHGAGHARIREALDTLDLTGTDSRLVVRQRIPKWIEQRQFRIGGDVEDGLLIGLTRMADIGQRGAKTIFQTFVPGKCFVVCFDSFLIRELCVFRLMTPSTNDTYFPMYELL